MKNNDNPCMHIVFGPKTTGLERCRGWLRCWSTVWLRCWSKVWILCRYMIAILIEWMILSTRGFPGMSVLVLQCRIFLDVSTMETNMRSIVQPSNPLDQFPLPSARDRCMNGVIGLWTRRWRWRQWLEICMYGAGSGCMAAKQSSSVRQSTLKF